LLFFDLVVASIGLREEQEAPNPAAAAPRTELTIMSSLPMESERVASFE
jgi:hypothetical protein